MTTPSLPLHWRYLLGVLPETEVHAVEEQLLADPDAQEAVEQAETELIDAFARGALGADEERLFARHYLATAEGRARVAFARALRDEAKRTSAAFAAPVRGARLRRMLAYGRHRTGRVLVATGAVAVATLLLLPLARGPRGEVRLVLPATHVRDEGRVPTLVLSPDAAVVRVRLPRLDDVGDARYDVELRDPRGELVWRGEATPVPGELTLPARLFGVPGLCELRLLGPGASRETVAFYSFRVERR